MIVYKGSKAKYYSNHLKDYGIGASIYGGRWNSVGVNMIYTAESISLVILEILVHLSNNQIPDDYRLLAFNIPDDLFIEHINFPSLPENWNDFPSPDELRQIGDNFVKDGKNPVLKVPSAVAQNSYNYLINPNHVDLIKMSLISVSELRIDPRLFT